LCRARMYTMKIRKMPVAIKAYRWSSSPDLGLIIPQILSAIIKRPRIANPIKNILFESIENAYLYERVSVVKKSLDLDCVLLKKSKNSIFYYRPE
jgi:hypothetical protein